MDSLLHKDNNNGEFSDDETGEPIDFIRQIVDRVREEFDEVVEERERKTFIHLFTNILAVVSSVKADNIKKNSQSCKINYFESIKNMIRTKLVPKKIRLQMPPQRKVYTKYKIKTLLPEQKIINIKKNGQIVRKITARRKTHKFTDRWAINF